MSKKIKIIIYIIVILLVVFLATKAMKQNDGTKPEILDKVVILEEAKVFPENEGKLVLVPGKLETDYYLIDDELDLEIDSCKAQRKVEMYQYTINNDEVSYEWADDVKYEYVKDSTGKKYYNPEKTIESSETYDVADLGEFVVPEGLTKQLPYNATIKDLPEVPGYKIRDDYLTDSSAVTQVGDLRIKLNYVDLEKLGEVSILAKQVGDSFEEYKLDNGYSEFTVYQTKITNKEELAKQLDKTTKDMYGGIIIVAAIIVVIGVILFKDDIKALTSKNK